MTLDFHQESRMSTLCKHADDATNEIVDEIGSGDYWSEHPDYPVEDWQHEVSEDSTRLSYWQWVAQQMIE